MRRPKTFISIAAALCLLAVGCATSDKSNTARPATGDLTETSIDVTLHEWEVVLSESTAPAGTITFNITNDGKDTHEFVVFRTDLDPGALPTSSDGGVDEEAQGLTHIDEVEDVKPGTSATLKVALDPGNYVVLCNIVEHGEVHYENGMRTALTIS